MRDLTIACFAIGLRDQKIPTNDNIAQYMSKVVERNFEGKLRTLVGFDALYRLFNEQDSSR